MVILIDMVTYMDMPETDALELPEDSDSDTHSQNDAPKPVQVL